MNHEQLDELKLSTRSSSSKRLIPRNREAHADVEVKTDFIAMTYSHAYVLMAMRFRIRLEEMTPTVKKVSLL